MPDQLNSRGFANVVGIGLKSQAQYPHWHTKEPAKPFSQCLQREQTLPVVYRDYRT
jgi:hypothetical protein